PFSEYRCTSDIITPNSSRSFYLSCSAYPQHLTSFPTRRSSDLSRRVTVVIPVDLPADEIDTCIWHELMHAFGFRGRASVRARCKDRKRIRLNSSHVAISYAVFCLQKITPNSTNV